MKTIKIRDEKRVGIARVPDKHAHLLVSQSQGAVTYTTKNVWRKANKRGKKL